MSQYTQPDTNTPGEPIKDRHVRGYLARIQKNAVLLLILLIVLGTLFSLTRAAVYKIRPYE